MRRCQRGLTAHNVIPWLLQADEHRLDDLRDAAFRFLVRNFHQVKAHAPFHDLESKPALMTELLKAL